MSVCGKFVQKSENETNPFPSDECGQTFEEKFIMKEHTKTNHEFLGLRSSRSI